MNGELETVASLLPYDEATVQRLDKLSVLRLAVSYLQIKAHFQGGFVPLTRELAVPAHLKRPPGVVARIRCCGMPGILF